MGTNLVARLEVTSAALMVSPREPLMAAMTVDMMAEKTDDPMAEMTVRSQSAILLFVLMAALLVDLTASTA